MKTVEVKVAENEADVTAGGYRQMATINVHAHVTSSGAVVDSYYAGSVLVFTNNPVLQHVIEQALQSHERSIGVSSGNFFSR